MDRYCEGIGSVACEMVFLTKRTGKQRFSRDITPQLTHYRHPCKLSRASGPRNPMKIASIPAIIETAGSGEIDLTVELLKPNVSLIGSVRD
jgi:hypothetical protein